MRLDASGFLTLLGAGRNVEEACAAAGVGRSTVSRWAARGRVPGADQEAAEFAGCLDAIREGRDVARLTEDDALRLLERSARRGSVQAQKALLVELRRREQAAATTEALRGTRLPGSRREDEERDPFASLPGDEWAGRPRNGRTPGGV
jgi:transposase